MRNVLMPLTEKSTDNNFKLAFCLTDNGILTVSGRERKRTVHGVDVTNLSIIKHIPHDESLNCDDLLVLGYLSYLYILRLVDTRTIRRLTKVPRHVVSQTRDTLFRTYDIVRYKIATMRCVYQSLTPKHKTAVEQQFMACGLRRTDAVLYYLLYDNNDIQQFIKSLQSIEDTKFVLDVDTLSRELYWDRSTNKEFEKAATYNTNKIRFIHTSNRYDFLDQRNDLKAHAIQAYYWVRPFYNKLHATNYAKNALRGYSQVLIDYHNKDERSRLIKTEDGYDNVIRDLTPDIYAGDSLFEIEDQMVDYLDEKFAYR